MYFLVMSVKQPERFFIVAYTYLFNVGSAHDLAMGDGATSGNSAALKQNSSPVPNNVNHESSKGDSSSSVKKHHSISSSLKDFSSPSVKREHSSSTSKSHLKENSHSAKSHHKHSTSEHKHSSKHKSSSSDHSKHGERKHHSSSSSHKQRDSSAHKSKDGSRHSSSNKSNSSSKEHSSSSKTKSKEKRHSENDVKKENGIDALPVKSLSESYIKTEPAMSPMKVKSESLSPLKITFKKEKTEYSDDDVPLVSENYVSVLKKLNVVSHDTCMSDSQLVFSLMVGFAVFQNYSFISYAGIDLGSGLASSTHHIFKCCIVFCRVCPSDAYLFIFYPQLQWRIVLLL